MSTIQAVLYIFLLLFHNPIKTCGPQAWCLLWLEVGHIYSWDHLERGKAHGWHSQWKHMKGSFPDIVILSR
jgi:hypothetical protein